MFKRLLFSIRYFLSAPWDTGTSPPELIEFIGSHPAGSALDLGCGTGTNAITLAEYGWRVVGVDFASIAIRRASRKAAHRKLAVEFHVGDVTEIEIPHQPFDLVLDIGCLHGLEVQKRMIYIKNLNYLLKSGGAFLLYAVMANAAGKGAMGLTFKDIQLIEATATQLSRVDGLNRGTRPSAWFHFQKK